LIEVDLDRGRNMQKSTCSNDASGIALTLEPWRLAMLNRPSTLTAARAWALAAMVALPAAQSARA
jgi:hypothetical protein